MNSLQKNLFLLILIFSFAGTLSAQRPVVYDSPGYEYALAKELFEKEKFGSAQDYFKQVFEDERTPPEMKINSYYYMGVCAIQLNNQDADFLLRNYIRKYPVHAYVPQAYLHLGKFYYDQKKYKQVLENFNNIQERNIPAEELAEYQFKKGYSYFATKKTEEAKPLFNEVRKQEGPYQKKAIYYLP
jgi:TolA-binding protein